MASTRVYVNEGMAHDLWVSTTWALNPFDLKESIRRDFKMKANRPHRHSRQGSKQPVDADRKENAEHGALPHHLGFFPAQGRYKDRPGAGTPKRRQGLPHHGCRYAEARENLFADNCASCHSSKRPNPMPANSAQQKQTWRDLVLRDDFLVDNYLSDDQRHPLSIVGTNAQRAMGTNAMGGHTRGQMSSQTYKDERVPTEPLQDQDANGKPIPLYDPLTGKNDIKFEAPASFYRTPTLVSVWATAPYLHNNALGIYTGDPSVAGRMAAYEDGMTKLLWPEKRLGVKSMKVTTEDSALPPAVTQQLSEFVPGLDVSLLRVPKGTPINLIMNIHPKDLKAVVQAYVDGVLQGAPKEKFAELQPQNHAAALQRVHEKMLEVSLCPDFIEDRGHTFGDETLAIRTSRR